jgi:hypothetical protein
VLPWPLLEERWTWEASAGVAAKAAQNTKVRLALKESMLISPHVKQTQPELWLEFSGKFHTIQGKKIFLP